MTMDRRHFILASASASLATMFGSLHAKPVTASLAGSMPRSRSSIQYIVSASIAEFNAIRTCGSAIATGCKDSHFVVGHSTSLFQQPELILNILQKMRGMRAVVLLDDRDQIFFNMGLRELNARILWESSHLVDADAGRLGDWLVKVATDTVFPNEQVVQNTGLPHNAHTSVGRQFVSIVAQL
ncbi:hypothetical protein SAMN04515620_13421 [Collimonas sp. OK607]|uniref:hypothetical protein n=1 Tax=Collimonas sp. OK607 TaxID=1798194 RepID=UPI0008EFD4A1|nr:hypothetical protein [Collimonas sp. OK607]SFB27721.1 hypothetical protein SAMN04515620_13421 [Collimonas sp. OK607]